MPIYKSKNLIDWVNVGTAFTESTRPTFEPKGGIWAPDINQINGRYVLYYSMSVWGGEWTCGIGAAVADKPEGPFTDQGMLFRSNGIGVQNSIDPFYIEDAGKKYLFWGSFRGIYAIELSDDGLSVKQDAEKQKLQVRLSKEHISTRKTDIIIYLLLLVRVARESIVHTAWLSGDLSLCSVLIPTSQVKACLIITMNL